jgi:hypothetical protein
MTDSAQRREVTALSAALQLVTVRSRTHAKERAHSRRYLVDRCSCLIDAAVLPDLDVLGAYEGRRAGQMISLSGAAGRTLAAKIYRTCMTSERCFEMLNLQGREAESRGYGMGVQMAPLNAALLFTVRTLRVIQGASGQ